MLVIALIMLAAGVLGANFAIRGSSRLAAEVRNDAFRQIQRFSFANIDEFSTGSLITRITNDITQIQNFTQTLLRGMFRSPVMLIGALVMSFALNPALARDPDCCSHSGTGDCRNHHYRISSLYRYAAENRSAP